MITVNDDHRRRLLSYPEAKILWVKEDCILGNHYHKKKSETFILSEGECVMTVNDVIVNMVIGKHYHISPTEKHRFEIKKDSVLIGLNSEPYDPTDDYKWEE